MFRVVVSGFPAFSGVLNNPTEELVRSLTESSAVFNGVEILPCLLPVEYRSVETAFEGICADFDPQLWIAFGVGRDSALVRLEQVAANWDSAVRPDNSGEIRLGQRIREGEPEQIVSTLDLTSLAVHLQDLGFDARLSEDAGRYICNHLFFTAMSSSFVRHGGCQFLFVHVAAESYGHSVESLVDVSQEIVRYFQRKSLTNTLFADGGQLGQQI